MSCEQAIEATIVGTRRLVRKQDTWFRRDQRVQWLDAAAGDELIEHVRQAQHGGEVSVWSQSGRGSTFTLVIPQVEDLDEYNGPVAASTNERMHLEEERK